MDEFTTAHRVGGEDALHGLPEPVRVVAVVEAPLHFFELAVEVPGADLVVKQSIMFSRLKEEVASMAKHSSKREVPRNIVDRSDLESMKRIFRKHVKREMGKADHRSEHVVNKVNLCYRSHDLKPNSLV